MNPIAAINLGDVATYIRGVTYEPRDITAAHEPGSIACFRTRNIQEALEQDDLVWIRDECVARQEQRLARGDLIVSSANSHNLVGKCARVPSLEYPATAGGFTGILRPNAAAVDAEYLFRWLAHPRTQQRARSCARRTTSIANLSVERFLGLELPSPLPRLAEQRRIAAILDKADEIRRKREESLRLVDDLLRATFLDMFGDPVQNPKGWPSQPLDAVAEIRSGVTKGRHFGGRPTARVPYLRVANVQDGRLALQDVTEIEVPPEEVAEYRLQPGDVVLTEGGDRDKLGRGAVWHGEIATCIHQNHVFRVRPHQDLVLPDYLSTLIGSARGKRYFLRSAKQTTGIASINRTQLGSFPVLLPPIQAQRTYGEAVAAVGGLSLKLGSRAVAVDSLAAGLAAQLLGTAARGGA